MNETQETGTQTRTSRPWRMPVLMYHGVPAAAPAVRDEHKVPVAELEEQLTRLTADGWQLLGLTEALGRRAEDPGARVLGLTFDDGLLDFLNAVDVLTKVGARATMYVPTADVGLRVAPGDPHGSRLSWSELADAAAAGVEIGSHSVQHRTMDVLPAAELRSEIIDSKHAIEDALGLPVRSFCYPHGYSSRRVHAAVRAAGFDNGCIVGRRIASSSDDRFGIPRLHVRPGLSAAEFDRLLGEGEPGLAPQVKRVAMPAWRLARRAALTVLHRELT